MQLASVHEDQLLVRLRKNLSLNRPFPSSPEPLYQNEVKCSAFDMEMIFILMQIKLIFTRKIVHLASFWKWRCLELWSGLLSCL